MQEFNVIINGFYAIRENGSDVFSFFDTVD